MILVSSLVNCKYCKLPTKLSKLEAHIDCLINIKNYDGSIIEDPVIIDQVTIECADCGSDNQDCESIHFEPFICCFCDRIPQSEYCQECSEAI